MNGELIRLGDTTVRFLVEGNDSGGSVAVFEVGISARGKMPAPQSHDSFEETIYGLDGVSTWTVEDAAVEVAPGERCAYRAARSIISITAAPRPGREGACHRHAGSTRPRLLPRGRCCVRRFWRWATRPHADRRGHATPRADSGSAARSLTQTSLHAFWLSDRAAVRSVPPFVRQPHVILPGRSSKLLASSSAAWNSPRWCSPISEGGG